jgi:PAS domain S-box-containing protein
MDAILTVDEEQRVVMFNRAAERMFQCPASEVLGQPITRFIPQRFHGVHAGHIRKFGETGVTSRTMGSKNVLWAVRSDGQEFQIEASISQVVIGGKKLFTVIHRDVTERVRAEAVRERLAAVVDSSDDAIISKDLNGIINAWNRGAEKIFGYSAAEAIGQPMLMLFPPDRVNEESNILERIRRGESVEHFETIRVRKDGTKIDISVTISPIRNGNGTITGASKIARDITERKQVEAALRESENRFRTLIEQASDAFFLHDSEGRFLEVNRQACESLGYTREELLGMCVFDVEQDFDLGKAKQAWEQSEAGTAYTLQGRQRRKDGTEFPVEIRLSSYSIDGQKLHLGLARDITERQLAEEALRRSDAGRLVALEAANLGEWEIDLSTQQTRRSRRHDQIFGYASSPEWSPEIFFHHVHPDDRARARMNLEAALSQGTKLETECRIVLPDGEIRWIRACGDRYRDSAGQSTRMFGTVEDITERKNAAESLRLSEERLRLAMDGAQMGTWHWNLETGELVWSPRCVALFGLPLDTNMTYEIFRGALHPDDRVPTDQAVRRCLDEHSGYDIEYRAIWPDRSQHWLAAKGQAYYDAAGKAVSMEGVVLDVTERREAQERLRVSEENYRTLFESMDEGFCTIEVLFNQAIEPVDYRFLEVNPAFEGQTGIQNARGKSMREIAPGHEEYWFQLYGKVALTGEPARVENEASQLRRWYDVHAFRVGEPNERKVAIIFNDISERKRQEAELRESEERFRLFIEHAPAALAMFDREMRYLHVSRRWRTDYGMGESHVRGVSHYEMFPEIPERWKQIHRRALGGEVVRNENDHFKRGDGSVKWLRWEVRPWRDGTGAIAGILAFTEDITERKLANDALYDSQERLRLALDGARLGTWNWDLKTGELTGSPLAFAMFGLPAETKFDFEIFLSTLHPDDRAMVEKAMKRTLAELVEYDVEYRCIWPDGTERWIAAKGRAYLNEAGGPIRVGGIVFDVTRRRVAELEIRELNESLEERIAERTAQLESANRELESFTYSVSHDLRAPLRHIQGFAGACLDEFGTTVDPQALHYLQRIQDGTQRMGLLINELLNLARTGQRAVCLQPTALKSVVEEIIAMLKPETEGREVEWEIGNLPSVDCDPVLIRQVFQNLLSNAIKYSRRRPRAVIEIGSIQEKERPVIFVRDNGAGFDMKYAEKLFGVFQRLHREEDFEGTGVGLATVHRIVQKHGGRIWAEAELDRGATFYFTLGSNEVARSRSDAATAGAGS